MVLIEGKKKKNTMHILKFINAACTNEQKYKLTY
jgi:hypothetical protein